LTSGQQYTRGVLCMMTVFPVGGKGAVRGGGANNGRAECMMMVFPVGGKGAVRGGGANNGRDDIYDETFFPVGGKGAVRGGGANNGRDDIYDETFGDEERKCVKEFKEAYASLTKVSTR